MANERRRIEAPEQLEGHELIASVSGGKDSTALILAMMDAGLKFRAVFADTGWEAQETYDYLDVLRKRLSLKIDVVTNRDVKRQWAEDVLLLVGMDPKWSDSAMFRGFIWRAGFPARMQRWCTRELKIQPIRDYHGKVCDKIDGPTASVVGVRALESAKRAKLPELDYEAEGPRGFGWPVWRPLIEWTIDDVLRIHNAHGIPVNPLYQKGFSRVGCFPCIYARKEEIKRISELMPERIDEIEAMEEAITKLRELRNAAKPGRYTSPRATFFQAKSTTDSMPTIRTIVEWAQTCRGGASALVASGTAAWRMLRVGAV